MKTLELIRYDIPLDVIQLWREQENDNLLPLQELAIKRHGLFGNGNLLIQGFVLNLSPEQVALLPEPCPLQKKGAGQRPAPLASRQQYTTYGK